MEDQGQPFFSIVMPVYNRHELAVKSIRSVLEQNFKSYQLIVVDDGSTDGSGEKLVSAFGNLIRVIRQENLERGAARNRGFRESAGRYVVFFDSDDIMLPDHLQVLHEKILLLNAPNFIATRFEFLKGNKRTTADIAQYNEGEYDYRIFLNGNPLACNICVRRENSNLFLFEEDRRYAVKEDWMFHLKNLRHDKLYIVDKVTLLMLDHDARSMKGSGSLLIKKTFLAKEWIVNNIDLSGDEIRKLNAQVNYFCAIHSYIDNERKEALSFFQEHSGKAGLR